MCSDDAPIGKARVVGFSDDQMVANWNAHDLTGFGKLADDLDVLLARFRIAGGVLVRKYGRRGVGQNRRLENLTRLNNR